MKYQWQFTTDEENPEGYFQKLVNMNLPEVLSLEEAAERLNELEQQLKESQKQVKSYGDEIERQLELKNLFEQQLKKAEEVIEFYGDKANWGSSFYELGSMQNPIGDIVIKDLSEPDKDLKCYGGKLARQYLKSRGE